MLPDRAVVFKGDAAALKTELLIESDALPQVKAVPHLQAGFMEPAHQRHALPHVLRIPGVGVPGVLIENRDLIAKPEDIEQVVLSSGMEEYLDENDYAQTVERLHRLVEIIKQRNWIVANSDVKDFTDRIDEMTQILDSRDSMVEER